MEENNGTQYFLLGFIEFTLVQTKVLASFQLKYQSTDVCADSFRFLVSGSPNECMPRGYIFVSFKENICFIQISDLR